MTPSKFEGIAIIVTFVIVLIIFLVTNVKAHSWYPDECCNNRDCTEVKFIEQPEGADHEIWHTEEFGPITVRPEDRSNEFPSKDDKYHICVNNSIPDKGFKSKDIPDIDKDLLHGHYILCTFVPMVPSV